MNVAETEERYEVTVELPGMKPEEFQVELKNGQLWISGEKKEEREEKGKTFHRVERRYGEFRRVIPLPTPVEEGRIEAQYKDGVLHVILPKAAEARPKHIEVKAE
jgi:HSP20 family protein